MRTFRHAELPEHCPSVDCACRNQWAFDKLSQRTRHQLAGGRSAGCRRTAAPAELSPLIELVEILRTNDLSQTVRGCASVGMFHVKHPWSPTTRSAQPMWSRQAQPAERSSPPTGRGPSMSSAEQGRAGRSETAHRPTRSARPRWFRQAQPSGRRTSRERAVPCPRARSGVSMPRVTDNQCLPAEQPISAGRLHTSPESTHCACGPGGVSRETRENTEGGHPAGALLQE